MGNIKHKLYNVVGKHSSLSYDSYQSIYDNSIKNPNGFWKEIANNIHWFHSPTKISNVSFHRDNFHIKWFEDGVLNPCYNCVDVHLEKKSNDLALICEHNDMMQAHEHITYAELHQGVCQYANAMKSLGIKKGDVIIIYMPMIKEAIFAMLASSRIGAIHCVVFTGFSSSALADRIIDSKAKYLITTDILKRGSNTLNLKDNVNQADEIASHNLKHIMVVSFDGKKLQSSLKNNEIDFTTLANNSSTQCVCEPMNAEDTLFILYTSGSTSKPKGIVHSCGGYMVYVQYTFKINFDYRDGDVYWSSADIGWITGHSYGVYGPLSCGAKVVIYDGIQGYPTPSRTWQIIEKHKVNIFYTAPTLIRTLMLHDDSYVKNCNLSSLRILGSVGEPINLDAWEWYFDVVGEKKIPIVDTWWQTETGGHMICPIPFLKDMEPTKASFPFFGIDIKILNEAGEIAKVNEEGYLCIANSWPGQARDILNDRDKYINSYFSKFPGYYLAGDGAILDENGRLRVTGRIDDIMNISGHRFSSAELENVVNSHVDVVESAVISIAHAIKGEVLIVLCITKTSIDSNSLYNQVSDMLKDKIGKIAKPQKVIVLPDLPKTRSGKIMRRLLKQIFNGNINALGDTSTLANPQSVEAIINIYKSQVD